MLGGNGFSKQQIPLILCLSTCWPTSSYLVRMCPYNLSHKKIIYIYQFVTEMFFINKNKKMLTGKSQNDRLG